MPPELKPIPPQQLPAPPAGGCRVLVFSDLHFGVFMPPFNPLKIFSKRFLGTLNHLFFRCPRIAYENIRKLADALDLIRPSVAICAGDLTSVSWPEEFERCIELLRPITSHLAERFLYLPGNHDAYVRDDDAKTALFQAFHVLNRGRWRLDELPVLHTVENWNILLVNAARPLAPHLSCGVIDQQEQKRIQTLLSSLPENEPVFAACHFPAVTARGTDMDWRHGLRGSAVLRDALASGRLQALLSGHVHHPYLHQFPGGSLQVCAGSLTLNGSCAVVDFSPSAPPVCHFLDFALQSAS